MKTKTPGLANLDCLFVVSVESFQNSCTVEGDKPGAPGGSTLRSNLSLRRFFGYATESDCDDRVGRDHKIDCIGKALLFQQTGLKRLAL